MPNRILPFVVFALTTLFISITAMAVEEGELAPDFTLPDIVAGGSAFSLSALRGKTVYLDFWASWCAPCLKSLPLYNALHKKYQDQGLVVVGINIDNPVEDGLDFLADTPLDFKIPSDPEGKIPELYELIGMPTSYLIAPDGTVKMVHLGFRDGDIEIVETAIKNLLAENR
jgi:cytochrome c biogenesis protein CcmG, thiol:disulfide interchange protein DsbE